MRRPPIHASATAPRAAAASALALALALAVAPLAGCGDRNLVLNVDVLSFMSASQTAASVGPLPAMPGGVHVPESPLVDALEVNLLEGLTSAVSVRDVAVRLAAEFADSTGAGAETLRVYVSDPGVDPRTTIPVFSVPVALTPGRCDTVRASLQGDPRVAELFTRRRMKLTVTTALRGPTSGADLNARVRLLGLDATVIAGRKGI